MNSTFDSETLTTFSADKSGVQSCVDVASRLRCLMAVAKVRELAQSYELRGSTA